MSHARERRRAKRSDEKESVSRLAVSPVNFMLVATPYTALQHKPARSRRNIIFLVQYGLLMHVKLILDETNNLQGLISDDR